MKDSESRLLVEVEVSESMEAALAAQARIMEFTPGEFCERVLSICSAEGLLP